MDNRNTNHMDQQKHPDGIDVTKMSSIMTRDGRGPTWNQLLESSK